MIYYFLADHLFEENFIDEYIIKKTKIKKTKNIEKLMKTKLQKYVNKTTINIQYNISFYDKCPNKHKFTILKNDEGYSIMFM